MRTHKELVILEEVLYIELFMTFAVIHTNFKLCTWPHGIKVVAQIGLGEPTELGKSHIGAQGGEIAASGEFCRCLWLLKASVDGDVYVGECIQKRSKV